MIENELRHYGILGMKWGVRRTEEQLARERGKKRDKNEDESSTKTASKLFDKTIKSGKDKSPISPAEKIGKESEKIIDNAIKLNSKMNEQRRRKNSSDGIKELTNDELKAAIERMRLEDSYAELNAKRISRGMDRTTAILDVIGTVVTIGSSGLAIASTIKSLKE